MLRRVWLKESPVGFGWALWWLILAVRWVHSNLRSDICGMFPEIYLGVWMDWVGELGFQGWVGTPPTSHDLCICGGRILCRCWLMAVDWSGWWLVKVRGLFKSEKAVICSTNSLSLIYYISVAYSVWQYFVPSGTFKIGAISNAGAAVTTKFILYSKSFGDISAAFLTPNIQLIFPPTVYNSFFFYISFFPFPIFFFCLFFFIITIVTRMRWYLVGLICFSLVICEAEHFKNIGCPPAWLFLLRKYLLRAFAHF